MKQLIIILIYICIFHFEAFMQNTISATYDNGDIPTSLNDFDEYCNGPSTIIAITLPPGENYSVTNVTVSYNMTALNDGWMVDQRSRIYFENNNSAEAIVYGPFGGPGTANYSRNLTLANGTYAGGTVLKFQMQAYRALVNSIECGTDANKVDNNTWTITVHYSNEIVNPKAGINTNTPATALEVNGKISISDDTNAPQAGMIRWNASKSDFEGYDGLEWKSFTNKSTSGGWGSKNINENQGYLSSDGAEYDQFGESVSIDGDYAVISSPPKNVSSYIGSGKVYIYKKTGYDWKEDTSFTIPDPARSDLFGFGISLDGSNLLVSAKNYDITFNGRQGKIYFYKRVGNVWSLDASFTAPDHEVDAYFGYSVAMKGNFAFVGSTGKTVGGNANQGKVYIYKKTDGIWNYYSSITNTAGNFEDYFGYAIALNDEYAVIGCPLCEVNSTNNQGRVFIYKRQGNDWSTVPYLDITSPDGNEDDWYGASMDIAQNDLVIGSPYKTIFGDVERGKVYVYKRLGSDWELVNELINPDGAEGDAYGFSVAISKEYLIVGAPKKNVQQSLSAGKAYLYAKENGQWNYLNPFVASDKSGGDNFSFAVGLNQSNIVVGALFKNIGSNNFQGKAYFFSKE